MLLQKLRKQFNNSNCYEELCLWANREIYLSIFTNKKMKRGEMVASVYATNLIWVNFLNS